MANGKKPGLGGHQDTIPKKDLISKKKAGILALFCMAILAGVLIAGYNTNWKFGISNAAEGGSVNPTTYNYRLQNNQHTELIADNGEPDAHVEYLRYEKPTDGSWTQVLLDTLRVADYTSWKTKLSQQEVEPDEALYAYLISVTATGYQNITMVPTLSDTLNITLAKTPTAVNMLAQSDNYNSTTIVNTTNRDWHMTVSFTDAQYALNTTMGYKQWTDYASANLDTYKNIIVFDTNATLATKSMIKYCSLAGEWSVSGDDIILETNADFLGSQAISFKLDNSLNTVFEIESVKYYFGTASALGSVLATCA